jgi:light-regulated signal transduction histidine kinase (bacteriophytochrome)
VTTAIVTEARAGALGDMPMLASAMLNILEDFSAERDRLGGTQRAVLNILEDFSAERDRLGGTQRAVLNILEDFSAERDRLGGTQRAVLNILEDIEAERLRIDRVNEDLRREITQRAVVEESLRQRTNELASSNAELEQFAYVASHDLQEPLRKVASFCQLLARRYQGQLDERADEYIRYAVEGALRMQQLIEDLLTFSRVARTQGRLESVDCKVALSKAVENLAMARAETSAEIVATSPLPTVSGDLSRMVQLFQNLLANAIKFRGDDPPCVEVSAQHSTEGWVVSVADNGIGMDAQYQDRVFTIFQRLHTREEYPGTGIGLAICRKVVEQFGGRIWFESELGKGTTFSWTLPDGAS